MERLSVTVHEPGATMELLSKTALWDKLAPVVAAEGFCLFDIDLPSRKAGILRIYIAVAQGGAAISAGIGLDQCAAVSRRISTDEYFGALLEHYTLEVSSPGINRSLQRPEHFAGAVGERIKVTLRSAGAVKTVVGALHRFDGQELELLVEPAAEIVTIALADVQKAQVDFLFD